ncbi:MAG TPA: hypothetical protein VEJ63_10390, partial [Planctomycetota bacterium]|nr:hypothetical protein [Planctomycetota bacterium]
MPENFPAILELNLSHFRHIAPELIVSFTFLAALVTDLVVSSRRRMTTHICLAGVAVAMFVV